jgi:hypothetical protein
MLILFLQAGYARAKERLWPLAYVRIPDELHRSLTGLAARMKVSIASLISEGMTPYLSEVARSGEVRASEEQFASDIDRLVALANHMTNERSGKRRNETKP